MVSIACSHNGIIAENFTICFRISLPLAIVPVHQLGLSPHYSVPQDMTTGQSWTEYLMCPSDSSLMLRRTSGSLCPHVNSLNSPTTTVTNIFNFTWKQRSSKTLIHLLLPLSHPEDSPCLL